MNNPNPIKMYGYKTLLVLIPLVALINWGIYYILEESILYNSFLLQLLHSIFSTAIIWMGCLFITTYLWKKYPWQFYPAKHLIIEIIAIILYTNLYGFFAYYLINHFHIYEGDNGLEIGWDDLILGNLITIFITTVHEAVFFYKHWKYNFSKSAQLEKENLQAQFENLKTQLNPHFLFNSLNSLFVLTDDNPKAQSYIQDLSEFLRYGIQNKDNELVSLQEEMNIVEKYIHIQKTRFESNLQFKVLDEDQQKELFIPPLSIQCLVENCIKHNIISQEKPLKISVEISQNKVCVSNNLQLRKHNESTGQGLLNLQSRYKFLSEHAIEIQQTELEFTVCVPLLKIEK